jgi:hypothetical protein
VGSRTRRPRPPLIFIPYGKIQSSRLAQESDGLKRSGDSLPDRDSLNPGRGFLAVLRNPEIGLDFRACTPEKVEK